MESDAGAAEDA
ncbi:hypothetical protein LINPERPRIM_LOCUS12676 [Linum perenne]